MKTPIQDPIAHACRLLRGAAEELKSGHTLAKTGHDWTGEPEAKAAYDEHRAVADALEQWATAIGAGDVEPLRSRQCLHQIAEPAVQQGDDFWPVDGNASRKQLIEQIGQMNFRLTALRQENAGLIARVKGQAEALRNYQSVAAPVAQGDAEDAGIIQWILDNAGEASRLLDSWCNDCDATREELHGELTRRAARSQAKEGASHG